MLSRIRECRRAAYGCGAALIFTCMMAAHAQDTITVILGEGTTNPGGSVEIPVTLDNGGAAPSTLVLFIAYDPLKLAPYMDYYQHIRTGPGGQIIYDANNNALTDPSPLSMTDALSSLGVNIQAEVHAQGVIGIILFQSTAVLPDGLLFKLAFRVLDGAAANEEILLDGISTEDPILIGGVPAASSASTSDAERLNVSMLNGRVFTGCTPPAIPGNVIASQGRPDAVEVTWSAIAAPYTQYRVYRSDSNDPGPASPLGDGWQFSTSFVDFSAKAPVPETQSLCCRPAVYREQRHYYWVKARTAGGCESSFSAPAAAGYRGLAKMSTAMQSTVAAVFPASQAGASEQWADPDDSLAIWLSSEEEVDPATVWVEVDAKDTDLGAVAWIPVSGPGAIGGWVTVSAPRRWVEATEVLLRAGAQSRTGRSIGPQVRQFRIRTDAECPVRPPIGRSWQEIPADSVSMLAEGVGPAYRILPETVYPAPCWIWLPVPEDIRPENLTLYYFSSVGGDYRWYPGERVAGWLAPGVERLRRGSVTYLGFEVRHGGLARLGYVPGKVPVAVAPAAVASGGFDRPHLEELIAIGLVLALFLALGFHPWHSHGRT